jgi:hypothetical protein
MADELMKGSLRLFLGGEAALAVLTPPACDWMTTDVDDELPGAALADVSSHGTLLRQDAEGVDPGPRPCCRSRAITLSLSRVARGSWEVEFHPACEAWADDLPQADAEALLAAIRVLRAEGPNLGRPLVDRIEGSRHANMKELRPGSTGRTEVRVLFAFDRRRRAILLVGGDKSKDWKGWYREHVPIADDRFDERQARIERAMAREKAAKSGAGRGKRRRGR